MNIASKPFRIFNYAFFVLLSIVTLYPFWYTIVASVVPFSVYAQQTLLWFPEQMTFQGYKSIMSNGVIPIAFRVTSFTTIVGTAASILMTMIGAYVLSKRELPGRTAIFYVILFTMLFGGGLIPMYITLSNYGMIDKLAVYIIPGLINTFYLIIMKTGFQELPKEMEEAAKIDGCSDIGILFRIILPVSLPMIATISLFYAVDRWNELYTAIFFINDTAKYTLQAVLYGMISGTDGTAQNVSISTGSIMIDDQIKFAAVIVATMPILIVYPFLQRYFVKGVMVGAIKA